MAALDLGHEEKRQAIEFLMQRTEDLYHRGVEVEILTTDNHADGATILQYMEKQQPKRVPEIKELLTMHGGCSAGAKMANVGPTGNVHACQFWGHRPLGNVRQTPLSQIWKGANDEFLQALRCKTEHVTGRCAECRYKAFCGGCRIRAEAFHGDLWGEDPACYLEDWKEQN